MNPEENKNYTEPENIEIVVHTTVEIKQSQAQETKTTTPKKEKKPLGKKQWSIIGAVALVVAIIAGVVVWLCLPKDNPSPEETTPETTTPAVTEPEVLPEGAIALSSVAISTGDTLAEQTAANDLKKYLEKKGVAVTSTGDFPITLSIDASLGEDAYRVTAVVGEGKEESLSIVGGNGRGVLYGVYAYLEKCANVRFFTPELEVCNPGIAYVLDGVLLDYTPALEMRQTDWYNWRSDSSKYTWGVKNGINIMHGWTSPKNLWPEELGGSLTYAPDLFVHTISYLLNDPTITYPRTSPNPCLCDEDIYNTVLSNVLKKLAENPNTKLLSVSQNDNPNYCECEKCTAVIEEEGSPAGPIIRFVNRIAAEVAKQYPNVTIDTLAYNYSLPAPKVTKPAENVCVRLSTINSHFNHAIKNADCYGCSQFRKAIKEWGEICDNLYVWDYTTNYRHYITTFPNFHVLRENMKFFAENHVKGVFEQGNSSGPSGEFGELRAYLIAKLLMNPYMTKAEYENHMNEFLKAYYGAGWENILKYINSFKMYATTSTDGMGIYTSPLTVISKQALANMKDNYNAWWDAAEAAAGDRLEYVQRSRLQLRYLLLFLEPNKEEAMQFVKTVEDNKIYWREGWAKLLWYVYEDDNALLGQAPDKWFK